MSFATRCTACGTIFRVVQDQLRVSEGWVRCGRCAEVFDAREQLFDIDLESPPAWEGDAQMAPPPPATVPMPEPSQAAEFASPSSLMDDSAPLIPASHLHAAAIAETVASHVRHEPRWIEEAGDSGYDGAMNPARASELDTTDASTVDISQPNAGTVSDGLNASIAATREISAEIPSFMRAAPAAARWKRSGLWLTMTGLAVLLLLTLALQLLFHFRDAIGALYPQSLPSLQALCQTSGCVVRPWRRIDAVSIENSALAQAAADSLTGGNATHNRYQLTLSLRNKSSVPVATPSIELSLLNPTGLVVLRRVLSPTDFQQERAGAISAAAILPGADLPLHVQLTAGAQRISGYSVEIFHP